MADGGKVRLSQTVGDSLRVTVFTSPTPVRVGSVDVSILLQDAQTGNVIRDGLIEVQGHSEIAHGTDLQKASHAQSTNRLLQSANLEIATPGLWRIALQLKSPVHAELSFPINVEHEAANMSTISMLVILPFVFIGLFLLREHITRRERNH